MRRVVVTGLGIVCPLGNSVEEAWKNALAGKSGVRKIQSFDASEYSCQIAGEIRDFDSSAYVPAKEARRFDKFVLYGAVAGSQALGFGFRAGFLGLLHMDIVQERLEREYNQDLITTAPSVVYEVKLTDGSVVQIENPSKLPPVDRIEEIREPIDTVTIFVPPEFVGTVIKLCQEKRGIQKNLAYHGRQVVLTYELPLAEIVLDFFDTLKSLTRGYASMDYDFLEFRASDVVKVDMLINGDKVDPLSSIIHRSSARRRGREIAAKLRELIPRQMYDVAIQAAIGAEIIARENVKALRKNVLAKCYGGDITRKRKLLEKQKAGKKRMKQVGHVTIPQEAFLAVLQMGTDKNG